MLKLTGLLGGVLLCVAVDRSAAQEATITPNYTPTVGPTITPNHTETPAEATITPNHTETPTLTPYIPPPTPKPYGRPGEIECWPTNANPRIACCYEWRGMVTGKFADGHWIILNCVATSCGVCGTEPTPGPTPERRRR